MKVTIELDTLDISRLSALCNSAATLMWQIANPVTKHEQEHLYWLSNELGKAMRRADAASNLMNPQLPGDKGFEVQS